MRGGGRRTEERVEKEEGEEAEAAAGVEASSGDDAEEESAGDAVREAPSCFSSLVARDLPLAVALCV
jgi:hypothetical protein